MNRSAIAASLVFRVRDTGIGMTEAQRTRLFQAFEQADTSITRRCSGTGLAWRCHEGWSNPWAAGSMR